ncbi:MAG: ATP-binding cassette domain-containing protein, partial [Deltaproteobacteria bacterium]|nr:ATP-binding cassette domain-containing protein [Deltaproteobacteria bacterium]
TCIIGTSGCGKSTLLKSLIGLLPPAAGEVELLGEDLYRLDEGERDRVLGRLGVMFQNGALLGSMTVEENVLIPLREAARLPEPVLRSSARLRLRQVGLEHASRLLPSELSGGMRKRAALARALILDPPLLFCDEPGAGLDPVTGARLDDLILTLREVLDITVVVVTHELHSIRRIADSIVMLGRGRLLFQGSREEALASDSPDLRAFFDRQGGEGAAARPLLEALREGGAW